MMAGSVKLAIIDMLSDAPTHAECQRIAVALQTSERYVRGIAGLYGGWTPTPMRKLPAVEAVVAAIRGGKSAIALAREHECSTAAVYRCSPPMRRPLNRLRLGSPATR